MKGERFRVFDCLYGGPGCDASENLDTVCVSHRVFCRANRAARVSLSSRDRSFALELSDVAKDGHLVDPELSCDLLKRRGDAFFRAVLPDEGEDVALSSREGGVCHFAERGWGFSSLLIKTIFDDFASDRPAVLSSAASCIAAEEDLW